MKPRDRPRHRHGVGCRRRALPRARARLAGARARRHHQRRPRGHAARARDAAAARAGGTHGDSRSTRAAAFRCSRAAASTGSATRARGSSSRASSRRSSARTQSTRCSSSRDARPGLEIVAVGPLTNLAVALAKDPDLAARIGRSDGDGRPPARGRRTAAACSRPASTTTCAPTRTRRCCVLRSGIPTTLVSADVTLRTWLREADVARIEAAGSAAPRALARALRIWTPVQRRLFELAGAPARGQRRLPARPADTRLCLRRVVLRLRGARDRAGDRERRVPHARARSARATRPSRCAARRASTPRAFRAHFVERVVALR